MSVSRIYTRTGVQALPGTKIDADFDNTNNEVNTHEASTAEHGATGAVVGTTNSQTLSNKTLTTPIISGGIKNFALNRQAVTTSVTLTTTTVIAGVTALTANRTYTLPSTEIAIAGRFWIIQDETGTCGQTYKITVATQGAETINGLDTIDLVEPYGSVVIYSNGTNCFVV